MTCVDATPEVFDQWAESYDDSPNPFCSLEARLLCNLLPSLEGKTVLDAGCGTGRHFELLVKKRAGWIHAADYSEKMLQIARQRLPERATLYCADCVSVPLPDKSVDIVVCSFVLGYVRDLPAFCEEMRRLLRPGGQIFVADVHPDTALLRGWRRSFQEGGNEVAIGWNYQRLAEVRTEFAKVGFDVCCDLGFPFSEAERDIFAGQGRLQSFEELAREPVMYVLQLSLDSPQCEIALAGARCALSAFDAVPCAITIENGRVQSLTEEASRSEAPTLALDGYLLLPGLLNAHDHLEFGLFPRLGKGPYRDAMEWAADIHVRFANEIALHRRIPRDVRVRWGALRNLLCGVTTVCHHNPVTEAMRESTFPVRVIENMRWVHSPGIDPEGLGAQARLNSDEIFVLHAGEGTSARAAEEIKTLRELGLLRSSTRIVHGLAIDEADVEELQESGVGLIFCPSSNEFLFGQTPLRELLENFEAAALGSDSPLTACGDLLEEAAFVVDYYKLPSQRLYSMLTIATAEMLQLEAGFGRVMAGGVADLIAVRDRGVSPAEALRGLSWKDIHLVLRGGVIQLASEELLQTFPEEFRQGFTKLLVDDEFRWIRGDWHVDFASAVAVQQNAKLAVGNRLVALA